MAARGKRRSARRDRDTDESGSSSGFDLLDQAARASDRATQATVQARRFAAQARDESVRRVRELGNQARQSMASARTAPIEPHLCLVMSPRRPIPPVIMSENLRVATYNVHRWQGANGRAKPDVARAGYVITELEADIVALQEVLRPFEGIGDPDLDPLAQLCEELDLHLAFAATRRHRRGQLGNAILSRFPITAISVLDISYSRIERRARSRPRSVMRAHRWASSRPTSRWSIARVIARCSR